MEKNIQKNISLLKALLHSYKIFNDVLIAMTFDRVFLETTKDFDISRSDLYSRIIA